MTATGTVGAPAGTSRPPDATGVGGTGHRPPATDRSGRRARMGWTAAGLVTAAALLAPVLAHGLEREFRAAGTPLAHRLRVFTAPVLAVQVEDASGQVTVDSGGHRTTVATSGLRGPAAPSDSEQVRAGTLVVTSTCPSGAGDTCSRDYVVTVPAGVAVDISTGPGDVAVGGRPGPVTVSSASGTVTIAGGEGPTAVHTGAGDVTVGDRAGPAELASYGGNVTVTGGAGTLRATTTAGDVTVSGRPGGAVDATSRDGSVSLSFNGPPDHVDATSQAGDVTVSLPGGSDAYAVDARSAAGTATVGVPTSATSARQVTATSTDGSVTVAGDGPAPAPAGSRPPAPPPPVAPSAASADREADLRAPVRPGP